MYRPNYGADGPGDTVEGVDNSAESIRIVGVFGPMHGRKGKFARAPGICQRTTVGLGYLTERDGSVVHDVAGQNRSLLQALLPQVLHRQRGRTEEQVTQMVG